MWRLSDSIYKCNVETFSKNNPSIQKRVIKTKIFWPFKYGSCFCVGSFAQRLSIVRSAEQEKYSCVQFKCSESLIVPELTQVCLKYICWGQSSEHWLWLTATTDFITAFKTCCTIVKSYDLCMSWRELTDWRTTKANRMSIRFPSPSSHGSKWEFLVLGKGVLFWNGKENFTSIFCKAFSQFCSSSRDVRIVVFFRSIQLLRVLKCVLTVLVVVFFAFFKDHRRESCISRDEHRLKSILHGYVDDLQFALNARAQHLMSTPKSAVFVVEYSASHLTCVGLWWKPFHLQRSDAILANGIYLHF